MDEEIDAIFRYRHLTTKNFVEDHAARLNEEAFEAERVGSVDLY